MDLIEFTKRRGKRLTTFGKTVLVLLLAMIIILTFGTISIIKKNHDLESAKQELEQEINDSLEISRKSLKQINADEKTLAIIDTYEQNINSAATLSERTSIAISMLNTVMQKINERRSESVNQSSGGQVANYQSVLTLVIDQQKELLDARANATTVFNDEEE